MSSSKNQAKQVVKNTFFLYFRMLFTLAVTLYTSRIILQTLGVVDFGIYNVVGGLVAMFSIVSQTLSTATSRFLTYGLARSDKYCLQDIFSTTINIQLGMSLLFIILAETFGLWFINHKMNLPHERLWVANWVYQISIFSFVLNLISIPYNASIIAHERMNIYAFIGILETLLKLLFVILLGLATIDKLLLYAVYMFFVALVIRFIYGGYCRYNFQECRYQFVFDKLLFKEMIIFAGWNQIGAMAGILRGAGNDMLLNIYFGPVINASRAISNQVNNAVLKFSESFMTAINPQIVKSYATNNYKYMSLLISESAKFSFCLVLLLSLPVFFSTEYILSLWLGEYPPHTILFIRLVLLFSLSETLSRTMTMGVLATGKTKQYQIMNSSIQLLNFPLSFLFLHLGFPPEVTLIIALLLSLIGIFIKIFVLKKLIPFSSKNYIKNVIGRVLLFSILIIIIPYFISKEGNMSDIRKLIMTLIVEFLIAIPCLFYIICNSWERKFIFTYIKSKL